LTFNKGHLKVSNIHKIYYEEFGNSNGIPILFLHGGPGAGFSSFHKKLFNVKKHRVIFFDQRGSGKSLPLAELKENNTDKLLNDIEKLRKYLKIEKWFMFGGSWGSTLAMLYGIKNPDRCLGFILRGIFLGTKAEIDWFLYGMKSFFPEAHNNFTRKVPIKEQKNILNWFYKNLNQSNLNNAYELASIWNSYESSCSTLKYIERKISGIQSLAISRIEAHYFVNNCFIKDGHILKNIDKISKIPCHIIQGRHDIICPPVNAFKLSRIWLESSLKIVEEGAHSGFEDCMFKQIQESINYIIIDTFR
tara:strand:- start:1063 stop:1977 length:915 start_codon:yes stop_codon:yes gene_type:complete